MRPSHPPTRFSKVPPVWPGDPLGIIAPAHYLDEESLIQGQRRLEQLGYRVTLCQPQTLEVLPFSSSLQSRIEWLIRAFQHPNIRAILAARGGQGTLELLPFLDPTLFQAHPKAFMGFSDMTALLLFLVHQAGLVAFHGPTLSKHAEGGFSKSLKMLNPAGFEELLNLKGQEYRVIIPGRTQGRITGGCLSLVVSLLGTPFFPDLEGWMLFLEDTGEPEHRLYRMLVQLKLAGVFDRARAVLFGPLGVPLQEPIVTQALKGLNIPVIMGIPSGHRMNMTPLAFGIEARLDTQEGTLRYLESPFLG